MRLPISSAATLASTACLLGALAAPGASQVGLELELVSGGGIGQNLIWSVQGQDGFSPLPQVLGVDFETIPGGVEIDPFGYLHLAASSGLIVLPGQPNGFYSLPVPEVAGLQGLTLYAQALGPALGAPAGTLLLSNLVQTTLSAEAPTARYAHTLCLGDGTLATMGIDGESGKPRSLGFVPAGVLPTAMATSSDGRFVWVVDAASNEILSFTVDKNSGRLSAGSLTACDPGTSFLEIDPTGQVLVAGSPLTDRVRTYTIDLALGTPTPASIESAPTVQDPIDVAFHAFGEYAYVLSAGENVVRSFQLDRITGTLGASTETAAPNQASRLLTRAKAGIGLALGQTTGDIRLYSIDTTTGTWTELDTDFRGLGSAVGAAELVEIEDEVFLYVDEPGLARLSVFEIDVEDGEFELVQQLDHGSSWTDLTWDGGGRRLFVTDALSNELTVLRLSSEGNIVAESRIRTRSIPIAVELGSGLQPLEFLTRSLFVAHEDSSELRAFQILGQNAVVLDQGGGVFGTQSNPVSVALAPSGDSAVTSDFQGDGLTSFPTNVTLGQLGTPQSSTSISPYDLVFDPSGRFLYVSSVGGQAIEVYRRLSNAKLAFEGSVPLPDGSFPRGLTIDPSGRFLYIACSLRQVIEAFVLHPVTGLPAPLGTTPVDGVPVDITIAPDGRTAYSVQQTPASLDAFAIDPSTGHLLELDNAPDALPSGPIALEVEPCGRFLYAACTDANQVAAFRLETSTGQPVPLEGGAATISVPGAPRGLASDAAGGFLFVSRNAANRIDSYSIHPEDGSLQLSASTTTLGDGPRGMAAGVELN